MQHIGVFIQVIFLSNFGLQKSNEGKDQRETEKATVGSGA